MSFSCRSSLLRRSLSCVSRAQTSRSYRRFCKAAERSTLIEEFEGNAAAEETVRLLLEGNRVKLAETITLIESAHPVKRLLGQSIITAVLEQFHRNHPSTFRVGITGPPGAGKSTFIETFGTFLTSQGHKVAVLAVDPSSSTTGGSLLGDRTRMPQLSRNPNAYIRPSPSSGAQGGVTRSTGETILLCEATGYNIILVGRVGVGQAEHAVADMVDMFVLLTPPGAGDELQGMKRGVVELADMVIVTKADGELMKAANHVKAEYLSALRFLKRQSKLYYPKVHLISCQENRGINEIWEEMRGFRQIMQESGHFESKRHHQQKAWMWNHIRHQILSSFRRHPVVQESYAKYEELVVDGVLTPGAAADKLLACFLDDRRANESEAKK
ncbi:methylmalonic aciduria type A protein, mitochondrial-like isoform X2 [Corticium candelabrum]|uniref:methylmalonic aciduria type A protein, mitochondrial-like isoform X2 n=1 Tax=Corticium candelabrum TaxID=121492 RepID=UPI002E260340|nr:methylmalonic aciduria type A protein, mitochondrial-like isoform X2 [Corticium candelabrum]